MSDNILIPSAAVKAEVQRHREDQDHRQHLYGGRRPHPGAWGPQNWGEETKLIQSFIPLSRYSVHKLMAIQNYLTNQNLVIKNQVPCMTNLLLVPKQRNVTHFDVILISEFSRATFCSHPGGVCISTHEPPWANKQRLLSGETYRLTFHPKQQAEEQNSIAVVLMYLIKNYIELTFEAVFGSFVLLVFTLVYL